jgi:hypothetical protein
MRYVDLMGGQKPHLLTRAINNLGAETVIQYALLDAVLPGGQAGGQPWIASCRSPCT